MVLVFVFHTICFTAFRYISFLYLSRTSPLDSRNQYTNKPLSLSLSSRFSSPRTMSNVVQKDWEDRELTEIIQLNILQVSGRPSKDMRSIRYKIRTQDDGIASRVLLLYITITFWQNLLHGKTNVVVVSSFRHVVHLEKCKKALDNVSRRCESSEQSVSYLKR